MVPMVSVASMVPATKVLREVAPPRALAAAARRAGLPPDFDLEPTLFIPYARDAAWAEALARILGEKHLGAVIGRTARYADMGIYSRYVLEAPNLLRALARGRRALPIIANMSTLGARCVGDHLVLSYSAGVDHAVGARHLEAFLPSLVTDLMRSFLGEEWRPAWIEMPPHTGALDDELEERFGGIAVKRGRAPGVAISLADLTTPNPRRFDPATRLTFADLPDMAGAQAPRTFSDLVRATLRLRIRMGDASVETVAEQLGLGVRTVQRNLMAENTSFREIRLEETVRRAMDLIHEGGLTDHEAAHALGYTETNSFRRAFRERTGMSPQSFRASCPSYQ